MFCVWCSVLVLLLLAIYTKGETRWPSGKYGLLKPLAGCPTGWDDNEFIFQDTVDKNPSNNRSEILHVDGYVARSYVVRSLCMKTKSSGSKKWPEGRYCIYRDKKQPLNGMEEGSVLMHNELESNQDAFKKTDGSFISLISSKRNRVRYIEFYFSCQTSGNKTIPIELPITKPFYLLPYGSRECQQVKWMVATSEWINYHTRNYQGYSYKQKDGTVPYIKLGDSKNKGITMYYCHYESCIYTLKKKKGVFQSPHFPRKYPNGQLCSWRIMVPVNHTIHVHFTNFSLYGNDAKDTLKYFIRTNGKYRLNQTFFGDRLPFTLTAKSNLKFEFYSDEANTSTGFRAEYNILLSRDTTTTTLSPTSRKLKTSQRQQTIYTTAKNTDKQRTRFKHSSPTDSFKKALVCQRDGTGTIVVIVIPLVCLLLVIVVVIDIVYRYRVNSLRQQHTSTAATPDIQLDAVEHNDSQMHQSQQSEYENPDYAKLNRISHPNKRLAEDRMYQTLDKQTRIPVYEQVDTPKPDEYTV